MKAGGARFSRRLLAALVVALLLVSPQTADASIFDVFGMTARGTAMGGAQGACARDHAGIYYNPAAMTRRKKTHVGVSLQLVVPDLEVVQIANTTRPAQIPETSLGITIGAVFPLGGKIQDRVALGVSLFLPVVQFTRYEAIDPATPQFYMYESLPDALVLSAALAVEIFEWWSIGVGAQILASFEGQLDVAVTIGDRRVENRALAGELFGEVAPVLGITLGPFAGVSLGVTYRDDISLDFTLPVQFEIEEIGLLDIEARGRGLYAPHQVNTGISWQLPWVDLLVAFDLTWMRWSGAPSPALSVQATVDDRGLAPDDPQNLFELSTVDPELGARDVWVPRVGAEYRFDDFLSMQAGYFFRASPLPDQVGYSNYIDNAAHVASLGTSFTWNDPLEVHDEPVSIDVFLQLTGLVERSVDKVEGQDTQNVGDWSAAGFIWNFGVEWRHDF